MLNSKFPALHTYLLCTVPLNSLLLYVILACFSIPDKNLRIYAAVAGTRGSKSLCNPRTSQSDYLIAHPETLIIIDSLYTLCSLTYTASSHPSEQRTRYLPPQHPSNCQYSDTAPHPLTHLKYLYNTLITLYSITLILLQKRHQDKSLLDGVYWKGARRRYPGCSIGFGSRWCCA